MSPRGWTRVTPEQLRTMLGTHVTIDIPCGERFCERAACWLRDGVEKVSMADWVENVRCDRHVPRRKQARKVRLEGRRAFDGADKATVTISFPAAGALFSVRPHARRRAFELPLEDVARMVIVRVAKVRAAERLAARRARRRS